MTEVPREDHGFQETPGRIDIALAIPMRGDRLLVARRAEGAHLGGFWEFPGGKMEAGEDPAGAAARELAEETGLTATALEPLMVLVHDYTEMPLRFHVFLARDPDGDVIMDGAREFAWKTYSEARDLEMPPANKQMLSALRWRMGAARPAHDE